MSVDVTQPSAELQRLRREPQSVRLHKAATGGARVAPAHRKRLPPPADVTTNNTLTALISNAAVPAPTGASGCLATLFAIPASVGAPAPECERPSALLPPAEPAARPRIRRPTPSCLAGGTQRHLVELAFQNNRDQRVAAFKNAGAPRQGRSRGRHHHPFTPGRRMWRGAVLRLE